VCPTVLVLILQEAEIGRLTREIAEARGHVAERVHQFAVLDLLMRMATKRWERSSGREETEGTEESDETEERRLFVGLLGLLGFFGLLSSGFINGNSTTSFSSPAP